MKIVFVSGLYNRADDLSVDDQGKKVKSGAPGSDVFVFAHDTSLDNIKKSISDNPDSHVILFSAGCKHSLDVAKYMKSLKIPLNKLHINEPYTIAGKGDNTKAKITSAISLGVPASNVYSGGNDSTGNNIPGCTKLKGRVTHFDSCKTLADYISKLPPDSVNKPKVDFSFSPSRIKPGEGVKIENKTVDATSYLWSANPSDGVVWNTSTASNPTITFGKEGTYKLSLEAKNGSGTETKNLDEVITVKKDPEPPNSKESIDSKDPNPDKSTLDPKAISTKIKLVKKSGPGELKGVVEKDSVDGKVTFEGLQIDQAGTYIIEAIPSSPDLEKTEIQIVVEKEPEIIEQEKKGEEDKGGGTNRPIIAQIDPTNQRIKPIKRPTNNQDNTQTVDEAFGIMMKPIIAYGGTEVAKDLDIKQLLLYYDVVDSMVPKCVVQFRDGKGIIRDQPPRDDTKFEVFIASGDVDIKSIHLVFKIQTHKQIGEEWKFDGILSVDGLYEPSSKSYNGTSFEALRKIAKKLDIGFNSNIENTDDSMKWINTNRPYKEFMREIVSHSYKDEKSFMYGYIDFYYCYNYVDIEKEWQRNTSNDYMVNTSNLGKLTKTPDDKFLPLLLTNEPGQRESCGFFQDFKILNQSTANKIESGYRKVVKYYDESKKSVLEFEVDSQTTADGRVIAMKGEEGDNSFMNKKIVKKFLGRFDSDNVHKNYIYAPEQNRINLDNLTSVTATLIMPNPNFNLYGLQKVPILFYNIDSSPGKVSVTNYRYTGDWIIINITFELVTSKKGNRFVQKLTIARKELGKTPDEQQQSNPTKSEPKEGNKNENETKSDSIKPNSRYKVGDKINVVKTDGSKYEIEVTKILDNGTDVEGKMKKI